ncbi:MAG: phenylacetate--CoA ligase family protein [Hyphomicrobiales bacterium]
MPTDRGAIPGAEFLPLAEIDRLQRRRWLRHAAYVASGSAFYRQHFAGIRLTGQIEEIADLPFTDKEMLRVDQRQHPPFGSYLTSRPDKISRIHRTSGTTGNAMNIALSITDAVMSAAVGARAQSAAGLGSGHRVVHCLNYQLWMGGYTDHASLEATGATVVPYGVGSTERLIRVIIELGITAISCTPSYPAVLDAVIAKHHPELKPRDLGIKLALFGGEPGLDDPVFRRRLESVWGFTARNANYGVSDVLCNFAGQTDQCNDLHLVALDLLYPELIDPDSAQRRPWKEGESGELVLTHLEKECQPLVRFRTGDIVTLTGIVTGRCGRTAPRFRVIGRSDDMVVVRGLNLFPSMVAGVVNRFPELSGEYRIVLNGPPPYDLLPLDVELADPGAATEGLVQALEATVKIDLGATARVRLLPPHSLPRTEGKTRRVFRGEV